MGGFVPVGIRFRVYNVGPLKRSVFTTTIELQELFHGGAEDAAPPERAARGIDWPKLPADRFPDRESMDRPASVVDSQMGNRKHGLKEISEIDPFRVTLSLSQTVTHTARFTPLSDPHPCTVSAVPSRDDRR